MVRGIDGVSNVCLCCLFIRFNVCSPECVIRHCVCLCVYVVYVCVCAGVIVVCMHVCVCVCVCVLSLIHI